MLSSTVWLASLTALVAWAVYQFVENRKYNQRYKFPAEIPGLPLIGNALQIPKIGAGPHMRMLASEHGEMWANVP